eukprot:5510561-Prymnesium_polylepis.2
MASPQRSAVAQIAVGLLNTPCRISTNLVIVMADRGACEKGNVLVIPTAHVQPAQWCTIALNILFVADAGYTRVEYPNGYGALPEIKVIRPAKILALTFNSTDELLTGQF